MGVNSPGSRDSRAGRTWDANSCGSRAGWTRAVNFHGSRARRPGCWTYPLNSVLTQRQVVRFRAKKFHLIFHLNFTRLAIWRRYPGRFAQQALGHNSKAVHYA